MKKSKIILLVVNAVFLLAAVVLTVVLILPYYKKLPTGSDGIGLLSAVFIYWALIMIPLLCIDVGYLLYKEIKRS